MSCRVFPNRLYFLSVENIINSGKNVELKVRGSSMHPTLVNGKHKVVLVPLDRRYLRVGMIALFEYNNKHLLHRLVALDADTLIFQGDNLPYTKEMVKAEDVRAFVGYIITPEGKVVDCRKRRYALMSRLFVSLNRYRFFSLKVKSKIGRLVGKKK